MRDKKLAIIDFDGTIVPSMLYIDNMLRGLLSKYGIDINDEVLAEIKPKGFINGAAFIKDKYKLEKTEEEICLYMRNELETAYKKIIPLKENVLEFLARLKEKNIKVCLATANQRDFVEAAVKRTGLDKYLDYLITIKDVNSTKNSSKIFVHCAEKFGIEPVDTMILEDSIIACTVAKEAGFYVVGVGDESNRGKEEEEIKKISDIFIKDFAQAIKLFDANSL